MKSIRIFLAVIVAVAGLSTAFAGLRQTTQRYEKQTLVNFTRITTYDVTKCINTDTNCTYIVVFKPGFTPPATLPADLLTNPPASVQSVTPDGNPKFYSGQ